ncbi:MAG TPA: alanine racemase [Anaerolineales bacterium]|nr:alanine racemase [Anaerolineales bacterium]
MTEGFSTWLEIDLANIRTNVRLLLAASGTELMAVVKADGYGHGAPAVARAAIEAGATWCGVARLDEALQLRRAGIGVPILVLGYTPPERIEDALAGRVAVTVYDRGVAEAYAHRAAEAGKRLRVHVKVDTGMGRLGMRTGEALPFLQSNPPGGALEIEGIFTHFARADEPGQATTGSQIASFDRLLADLESIGKRPVIVHAANSSGTLNFPQARYDLVRCGIAVYGIAPSPAAPLPPGYRAALAWKARLISKKTLPPGHGVSYGHAYVTQAEECIGAIPVGYADGFRRVPGNFVLIAGRRVPVVGTVAMDQVMVQLDSIPQAEIGAEVVVIGRQGDQTIRAGEIAGRWGTISYEVVCGLAARLPRVYLNE